MIVDKFGQHIYDKENDLIDALMQTENRSPGPFMVENINNIDQISDLVGYEACIPYTESDQTVEEFDIMNQSEWFMPKNYKELDIAKHILDLCNNDAELQRCGEELLLYQEFGLFDLLRYLVYLVDTMTANNVIWGVGRGSSVSSFVLYKLKIHRVDSLFYDLQIKEFLR